MSIFHLLEQDSSWVINKLITKTIGLHEALLLSDLIMKSHYFEKKEQLQDGYFFYTMENISKDTTLSKHQIRKAIKNLTKEKLIYTKRKGLPARIYYRINNKIISELQKNN